MSWWTDAIVPLAIKKRKYRTELEGVLYVEELRPIKLVASATGSNKAGKVYASIYGECEDVETGEVMRFRAEWLLDMDNLSGVISRWYLAEVDIIEDD